MIEADSRWRPLAFVAIADAATREQIAGALRDDGWAVIEAATNIDLLQTAGLPTDGAGWWAPELLVAEALSPGCSGATLAAGLRELGWTAPIVLLTDSSGRGPVSDDPENSVFTADHCLGVPIVREIAHHRLRSAGWTPHERKEDLSKATYRSSLVSRVR